MFHIQRIGTDVGQPQLRGEIIVMASQMSKVPNITLKTERFRINIRREWCPVGL